MIDRRLAAAFVELRRLVEDELGRLVRHGGTIPDGDIRAAERPPRRRVVRAFAWKPRSFRDRCVRVAIPLRSADYGARVAPP
jgi:hypothetical protein